MDTSPFSRSSPTANSRSRDLQAHTIWEYLEDQLNFQVNSGKIDVNATYQFSLKDDVDLKVDVSKVALTDLAVRPRNSDVDWISRAAADLERHDIGS